LDGGGAKGFYTLGVLREIEGLVDTRLHQKFDLISGTSTGAIIAAALALGHSFDEIHALYKKHVVTVMACKSPADKTAALKALATEVEMGILSQRPGPAGCTQLGTTQAKPDLGRRASSGSSR
jgi:predicted acylesterase/phospholipase RssA